MKKQFPNALTLCNLVCGCIAVRYALMTEFPKALLFIVLGAVFDFFDGFAARKLHVSSPIGKELDSLADNITFGFAPAAMMFILLESCLGNVATLHGANVHDCWYTYIKVAALLIAAFSAYRLAKFNLDSRQTTSFLGLPTPANALLTASFVMTLNKVDHALECLGGPLQANIAAIVMMLVFIAVTCWLLVSELPLFSLKFKDFSWTNNRVRYIFILTSAIALIISAFIGWQWLIAILGCVIVWYIVLSLFTKDGAQ